MAKVKKHRIVFRDRFLFARKNYEAETVYNIAGGIFPSRKIVQTTFGWVIDHLSSDKATTTHASARMAEKRASNRPIRELLKDGEVVELRFGKYSKSLRAAIIRISCGFWDDVYVVSFAESEQTANKIDATIITAWRNRSSDRHNTLKKVFGTIPVWETVKEQF